MDLKPKCLTAGCYNPRWAKNLCNSHYLKQYFSQFKGDRADRGRRWVRKDTLAREVSALTGLTIKEATKVINVMLNSIGEALKRDERVYVRGFGTFNRHHRSKIHYGHYVFFNPAKELRRMVNTPGDQS